MELLKLDEVANKIQDIRERQVILDHDLADLYGVETRDINKAVKNNQDKFPAGYVFELTTHEFEELRRKISTTKLSKTRVLPKAFTEKGLYMLATILKSPRAVQTTIAIIETFSRIRELSRTIQILSNTKDKKQQEKLMQKSGDLIARLIDDDLETTDTETSIERNFAVLKFKHLIKRKAQTELP